MTDDLAAWLLEQIAEDDRQVRGPGRPSILGLPQRWYGRVWLPQRIRAECDAKRRIIEAVQRGAAGHPEPHVNYDGQDPADYDEYDTCQRCIAWSETTLNPYALRLLTPPYEDRPGYREEWRP